jgi:hypothetical protein
LPSQGNRVIGAFQDVSSLFEENASRFRQLEATLLTVEQLRADDLFKAPNLLAEGRLHGVQPLRNPGQRDRRLPPTPEAR